MQVNRSIGLEGVGRSMASETRWIWSEPGQAPGSPRFQMNDGVLQREMRWQHMFMAFSHCLWVLKGRTDVSDRCSVPGIRTSVP